uniref:Uncharacterized protein n=1 Tax=Arundo donax TaxID=35708 RepID=A0A0A9GWN4_ARUDO
MHEKHRFFLLTGFSVHPSTCMLWRSSPLILLDRDGRDPGLRRDVAVLGRPCAAVRSWSVDSHRCSGPCVVRRSPPGWWSRRSRDLVRAVLGQASSGGRLRAVQM